MANLAGSTESIRKRVLENWQQTVAEVATAALQAGRSPAEVRIVGVTKYVDVEVTRYLIEAGCTDAVEA